MTRGPEIALPTPLGSGQPIVFSHPLLQRTTLVLVELDMNGREVIVNRDLSTFARLRLDGTIAWGPLTPGAIAAQNDTFRYLDGQWAAWDAYVENTRYRLGWSTQKGKGQYETPKGRSITSAAMDARGRHNQGHRSGTQDHRRQRSISESAALLCAQSSGVHWRRVLRIFRCRRNAEPDTCTADDRLSRRA